MLRISNRSKLPLISTTTNNLRSLLSFPSKPHSSSSSSSSTLSAPSHDRIARLILEQKTPSQALHTFKWASQLPNFTHSQSTYRALFHKLCAFRRFDTVKQLLDEMPQSLGSSPDDDVFVTIIRGLGRARMIRDVTKVPCLVSKFGKNPSLKIFNSILDVLVREDIDLAREFYRKKMMGSGVQGDDYTYGILMKGLCLTNRIADGFKLLQVMKCRGARPNTVIYNTLLHALCKNGKVGRARSLMSEMEEPNDVTFNILISGYCKEENFVQALAFLEKSFSSGFVPDVITVTKVMEILCNVGRVTEAVEVIERVESKGGVVDVVAYNTLIKGYCGLGKMKVALSLLKEMERKGCLANVDTYNALISGFCDSGMLDSALDMGNNMKIDGISWNFITYDTLIRGLFSGGRIEDGFKILELMEESKRGSRGHISPYNSVIYGLYRGNRYDEALEFLTKMEKLFPRAIDRTLRILGLCEESKIEDAYRVYEKMIAEGGVPSVLVYDYLIHGFCREGCVQKAFALMNEMVGHGYFPVESTFNSAISQFCRQDKTNRALKLLEDMVGRGCTPDTGSYSPLIDALCRKGDFQSALNLLLQMMEKGIIPNHIIWNSLILCLGQQPIWSSSRDMLHVNNLIQEMVET